MLKWNDIARNKDFCVHSGLEWCQSHGQSLVQPTNSTSLAYSTNIIWWIRVNGLTLFYAVPQTTAVNWTDCHCKSDFHMKQYLQERYTPNLIWFVQNCMVLSYSCKYNSIWFIYNIMNMCMYICIYTSIFKVTFTVVCHYNEGGRGRLILTWRAITQKTHGHCTQTIKHVSESALTQKVSYLLGTNKGWGRSQGSRVRGVGWGCTEKDEWREKQGNIRLRGWQFCAQHVGKGKNGGQTRYRTKQNSTQWWKYAASREVYSYAFSRQCLETPNMISFKVVPIEENQQTVIKIHSVLKVARIH